MFVLEGDFVAELEVKEFSYLRLCIDLPQCNQTDLFPIDRRRFAVFFQNGLCFILATFRNSNTEDCETLAWMDGTFVSRIIGLELFPGFGDDSAEALAFEHHGFLSTYPW